MRNLRRAERKIYNISIKQILIPKLLPRSRGFGMEETIDFRSFLNFGSLIILKRYLKPSFPSSPVGTPLEQPGKKIKPY
jgi:hypothetical protein